MPWILSLMRRKTLNALGLCRSITGLIHFDTLTHPKKSLDYHLLFWHCRPLHCYISFTTNLLQLKLTFNLTSQSCTIQYLQPTRLTSKNLFLNPELAWQAKWLLPLKSTKRVTKMRMVKATYRISLHGFLVIIFFGSKSIYTYTQTNWSTISCIYLLVAIFSRNGWWCHLCWLLVIDQRILHHRHLPARAEVLKASWTYYSQVANYSCCHWRHQSS